MMTTKSIIVIAFFCFFGSQLFANCDCTDCPEPLESGIGGGVISEIEVSGATNPIIGSNGQGLRSVRLHLVHASLEEIDVILRKQGGGPFAFSRLIEQNGSSTADTVTLEVCFINCDEDADPDTGFPEVFDSGAGYSNDSTYTGKYFPSQGNPGGCFDDRFNGLGVNGVWELAISGSPTFGGTLVNWELDFYDNSGTSCQEFCVIPNCQADGGDINGGIDTLVEGDPDLNRDLPPSYSGSEPDPSDYGYTYVITDEDSDIILDYDEDADLTAFDPGTYVICGLSYLLADFDDIPDPNGSYTLTDLQDEINEPLFCADLSENCETITILPVTSTSCECTNCELTLPLSGSAVSEIEITGATNPTIGSNGQGLRAVRIFMVHDAIEELDMTLVAPNGAIVNLMEQTGLSIGDNITFDICFLNCDETADPDPGFPEVFDSGAGYEQNSTYSGSYFPANGCFSNYNGSSVNGTWRLEIFDGVGGDGGTLFDWELEFYDNDGTNCEQSCDIDPCQANAGEIDQFGGVFCEGNPNLNLDIPVDFAGNEPDPDLYGYQFVVSEDGVILDFLEDPDLTGFSPGIYSVCGFSYLLADSPLIPNPNGSYSLTDLEDDISSEVFCGDLTDDCWSVEIIADSDPPEITGSSEVCVFEEAVFIVEGIDPDDIDQINVAGPFNELDDEDEVITVTWAPGPSERTICVIYSNACISGEVCITVEILQPPVVEINGIFDVCEGVSYIYDLTPPAPAGTTWDILVVGGNLINVDGDSFEVEWFENGGVNNVQVILNGGPCGDSDPVIAEVNLISPDPPVIDVPLELCLDEIGTASVDSDPQIIDYFWSGDGITIISGQFTNGPVEFSVDQLGTVEICLEIETDCGVLDPICEFIEVLDQPMPEIDPIDPQCDFEFILDGVVQAGSDVSWEQIDGPSTAIFSDPFQNPTSVEVFEPGFYIFELTENNGTCEGTSEIIVEILEGPELEEVGFFCEGGEYEVEINISGGAEPYVVNGNPIAGNSFISDPIASGQPYSFVVTDNADCSSEISAVVECPCIADAGSMSQEILTACLEDNETVTAVSNGDFELDINDIAIFVLHHNPGPTLGTIFDSNETGVFEFQAGMIPGETYYISLVVGAELNGTVDLDDECLSVSIGQPVIFYGAPEFELQLEDSICGTQSQLEVILNDPSDLISWNAISWPGAQPPSIANPDAAQTPVEVSSPGIYTFEIQVFNEACIAGEIFEIEFFPTPSIANTDIECISSDVFNISFTINGSGGNFEVSLDGETSGNQFTSDLLESGVIYDFSISDALGCEDSFTVGPVSCDCIGQAGSMASDTLFFCETGGLVEATYNEDANPGQLDSVFFVIHSGSGNQLVDPVFFTAETTFELPPSLLPSQLYYLSNIVVPLDQDGQPDFQSSCLVIGPGQPLFIYSLPAFALPGNQEICEGTATLEIQNGIGGSTEILFENTNGVSIETEENNIILTPSGPGQVVLQYTETNGLCVLEDTVTIDFWERPAFTNLETVCTGDSFAFTVDFTGGLPPYILNGDTLPINSFESDTFPSGLPQELVLTDSRGCTSDSLIVSRDCECEALAGTFINTEIQLCEGESLNVENLNLENTEIPDDYSLFYVLLEENNFNRDDIILVTSQPNIPWSPDLETNRNYYLVAVVSTDDGGAINFNDPCISISNTALVRWQPTPLVSLSGNAEVCLGDSVEMTFTATGDFPLIVFAGSNLGNQLEIVIENEIQQFTYFPFPEVGEEIWQIDSVQGNCPAEFEGSFFIEVTDPAEIFLSPPPPICNNNLFGSILDLNALLNDPLDGEWTFDGEVVAGSQIDLDGFDEGFFELEFSTAGFEDPCPGSTAVIEIEVVECNCPVVDLPEEVAFCALEDSIDLRDWVGESPNGSWSLNNPDGNQPAPLISDGILVLDDNSSGEFELVFALSDSLPDECPLEFTVALSVEASVSAGNSLESPVFCETPIEQIDLNDFLENSDTGGQWTTISDETIEPILSTESLEFGINILTYTIQGEDLCPGDEVDLTIFKNRSPALNTEKEDPLCFGDENGFISIEILNPEAGPYRAFLNGEEKSGLLFEGLRPGDYLIEVIDSAGCRSSEIMVSITEPDEIFISAGPDIQADPNELIGIDATTNVPEEEIELISWSDDNGELAVSGLSIEFMATIEKTLVVELLTVNGCLISDAVNLSLNPSTIYIPNVFRPRSSISSNAVFGPLGTSQINRIVQFQIYDRWGNRVFEVKDLSPTSNSLFWDGNVDGEEAPQGVYVYHLIYTDFRGEEQQAAGDVTLLR